MNQLPGRFVAVMLLWGAASMPTSADDLAVTNVTPERLRELRLVDTFQPQGVSVKGITVRDDLAYVVAGYGGFFVLDVADADELKLLGKCDTPGNATEVAVRGSHAYVGDRPAGVQIVDVSDPANPHIVGIYDSVELATGLDVAGNLMGVCNRTCGVEFVDVTDPVRPRHLSALRLGEAQGIRIREDLAYVGLWHNRKLAIVDITNPREPFLRGEAALGGYGWGFCLRDELAYAATGHHAPRQGGQNHGHGLDVVDVSDPDNPRSVRRLNTPPYYRLGNDWWWTEASGKHLFHADGENGVFVYGLQDPTDPVPLAHAPTANYAGAVALLQDRILVADMKGGLRMFEAEGLASPVSRPDEPPREIPPPSLDRAEVPGVTMYDSEGQIRRVAALGEYAILAAGMAGLEVVSLSLAPERVAALTTPGVAFDVQVNGDVAYAALGSAGVGVLDVSDPLHPRMIGRFEGRAADHVELVGHYLAAMRGEGGIDFLDMKDPTSPVLVGRGSIPHFPSQLSALVERQVMGVSPWEIALFDLADPQHADKTVLSKTDRDGASGVMVKGTQALVCRASALELWDLADLEDAGPVASTELPAWSGGVVYWSGTRAAISNRRSGVVTFAEVAGEKLRIVKQTTLPGYPGRALIRDDLVLIPCGYSGLAVVRWEDLPRLP